MRDDEVCEAFAVMAQLGNTVGAGPLSKHEACWEFQIDEQWKIAVNGHKEAKVCSLTTQPIEPFNCYVEYNGWPAGIIDPRGGILAAGSDANENTFIDAMKARIEKEKP